MPELTRAKIKQRRTEWQVQKVEAPELGDPTDHLYVRQLGASVYRKHKAIFADAESVKDDDDDSWEYAAKMCALGICAKDGQPLYEIEQAPELLEDLPNAVLQRCMEALTALNKLGTDVKTKAKNSPASRRSSSRSGSRTKSRKRRT